MPRIEPVETVVTVETVESASEEQVITALTGWAAPPEVLYDPDTFVADMPWIRVVRGGIQFPREGEKK